MAMPRPAVKGHVSPDLRTESVTFDSLEAGPKRPCLGLHGHNYSSSYDSKASLNGYA